MKTHKIALLLLATLLLSACASEEEKKERRENAFDLSGDYKASKNQGSELDMSMSVRNEKGRHDIVVYLERLSGMSDKEATLLRSQGIDPTAVSRHFTNNLVLGKGYSKVQFDGGENISSDFGESSQFSVCTAPFQYSAEYQITYCVSGTAKKKDRVMNGSLTLSWDRTEKYKENDEEKIRHTSKGESLKFKSDISMVFYKQYLGSWSGEVFSIFDDLNKDQFRGITLNEKSDLLQVNLTWGSSITYRNEVFQYNALLSQTALAHFKKQDYPAVQLVFTGSAGKRIVLFGQLWSLGDFTGSITLLTVDKQIDIGSFRFKKN